jgi:hypothetical protein
MARCSAVGCRPRVTYRRLRPSSGELSHRQVVFPSTSSPTRRPGSPPTNRPHANVGEPIGRAPAQPAREATAWGSRNSLDAHGSQARFQIAVVGLAVVGERRICPTRVAIQRLPFPARDHQPRGLAVSPFRARSSRRRRVARRARHPGQLRGHPPVARKFCPLSEASGVSDGRPRLSGLVRERCRPQRSLDFR